MVAAMPPQTCRERSRACRLITGYFLLIIASIIVIPTSIYMVDYLKGGDWGTPLMLGFVFGHMILLGLWGMLVFPAVSEERRRHLERVALINSQEEDKDSYEMLETEPTSEVELVKVDLATQKQVKDPKCKRRTLLFLTAKIEREKSGIAHITAETELEANYGLGYAHAQDRFWQMELQRLLVNGQLSSRVGEAGVEIDKYFLSLGFNRIAARDWDCIDNKTKSIFESYVSGVNAFIDENDQWPVEMRLLGYDDPAHFTGQDSLALGHFVSFQMASNWYRELARFKSMLEENVSPERLREFSPSYPDDGPTILKEADVTGTQLFGSAEFNGTQGPLNAPFGATPGPKSSFEFINELFAVNEKSMSEKKSIAREFIKRITSRDAVMGSNNWAIHGSKTSTGKPLLCNDPHLTGGAPWIWYLANIKATKEDFNAIGASIAGAPSILLGRNNHVAWGVTLTLVDMTDIYVIEDGETPGTYRHNGQDKYYWSIPYTIEVKGDDDVDFTVFQTVHGPLLERLEVLDEIMPTDEKHKLALRWPAFDDVCDTSYDGILDIASSKNMSEFESHIKKIINLQFNYAVADDSGNIGYFATGRMPQRVPGHEGDMPTTGDGTHDWLGYMDMDANPRKINAPYVYSANNRHLPASVGNDLSQTRDMQPKYRATRIEEILDAKTAAGAEPITRADMEEMILDIKNTMFAEVLPTLKKMQPYVEHYVAVEWLEKILEWDAIVSKDSSEAYLYERFVSQVLDYFVAEQGDHWENYHFLINLLVTMEDAVCVREERSCLEIFAEIFQKEALSPEAGDSWGTHHKVMFKSILFGNVPFIKDLWYREIGNSGDTTTINVSPYNPDTMDGQHIPSYRQVIDLADPESSLFMMPLGNNGNIFHENYDDWVEMWRNGEWHAMITKDYDVETTTTLKSK